MDSTGGCNLSLTPAVTPAMCCVLTVISQSAIMTSRVKRLQANGLNFAVSDQGDERATAIVLLHGFPNNKNLWKQTSEFGSSLMESSLIWAGERLC